MRPPALAARHAVRAGGARAALVAGLALLGAGGATRALAASPAPAPAADPAWLPPPPGVLFTLARALRAEGDVAGARERLERALVIAPAYDDARLELADLLLADGRELDRVAELLGGVRAPHPRTDLLLARLAELRAEDAAAAAAYARALEAADDPDVRLRRALALDRLGRSGEAIGELERVRAARPGDVMARGRLAVLYERGGRLRQAEAEYRAVAKARPGRAQGWDDLAAFLERVERPAEAKAARAKARAARGRAGSRELRPLPPSKR